MALLPIGIIAVVLIFVFIVWAAKKQKKGEGLGERNRTLKK